VVHPVAGQRPLSCAGMPSSDMVTPEAAVRAYLQFLEDPSKLVDAASVKRLEGAVAKAKDPVDRLKAIAAVEKAKATDEAVYRADFVKLAKQWAAEEDVPAGAFREMGVSADGTVALAERPVAERGRAA
jgi:hypothetical protein